MEETSKLGFFQQYYFFSSFSGPWGCSRMPFQIMDHRGVSASSHFFEDVSFRSEVFIVNLVSCELLKCDTNNLMIIRSVISHCFKMLFIFSLTFNAIALMNRWFSKLVFLGRGMLDYGNQYPLMTITHKVRTDQSFICSKAVLYVVVLIGL